VKFAALTAMPYANAMKCLRFLKILKPVDWTYWLKQNPLLLARWLHSAAGLKKTPKELLDCTSHIN
jgi:hypothetical protein